MFRTDPRAPEIPWFGCLVINLIPKLQGGFPSTDSLHLCKNCNTFFHIPCTKKKKKKKYWLACFPCPLDYSYAVLLVTFIVLLSLYIYFYPLPPLAPVYEMVLKVLYAACLYLHLALQKKERKEINTTITRFAHLLCFCCGKMQNPPSTRLYSRGRSKSSNILWPGFEYIPYTNTYF